MANLFFPQLLSGALAQYPIRKNRLVRTISNLLPDGSLLQFSDPGGSRLLWDLEYTELSIVDMAALQAHFTACAGPVHAFTFIDPTDNMLASSSDLTAAVWQTSPLLKIATGISDPMSGTGAVSITNTGQAMQQISQTLSVPANYQYCFSLYAAGQQASNIELTVTGNSASTTNSCVASPNWTRVSWSGRLNDPGTSLTIGLAIAPAQTVQIYGLQLEAQLAPSRYRATGAQGGVYANAHWAVDQIASIADAPGLFSTSFTIETAI
jgi:hypothetical protein